MNFPANLKYTETHEWVRVEGDIAVVGITDHAQEQLGEVVFVELPSVGTEYKKGADFGTVESSKAVGEIKAPVSGKVTEVNSALEDEPGKINSDPYGDGFLIKIKMSNPAEVKSLLDAASYQAKL